MDSTVSIEIDAPPELVFRLARDIERWPRLLPHYLGVRREGGTADGALILRMIAVRPMLGLHGAEIVFNPSATVAGLSEYLWKLEQPAHAVANGYYVGAINRVGIETPWNLGEFYGQSYLVDPRGQFVAMGSRDKDEVVIGVMDRDVIREVRNTWQFYRDRRPDSYDDLVAG